MSRQPSFGAAFKEAHGRGGPGHIFEYNGKQFTTNCKDGGDDRRQPNTRSAVHHDVRAAAHDVNAFAKDKVGTNALDHVRRAAYGDFNAKPTSSDVDRQRAAFHRVEAAKERAK